MATKVSLGNVVKGHYGTLYDNATGRRSIVDWLILVGVPIAVGLAAWRFDFVVVSAGQILAGVSIIGGFLFGLLTFVFQLRINATADPRIPSGSEMATLLDELFYNVAYTTLVAFVTAGAALLPMSIGHAPAPAPTPATSPIVPAAPDVDEGVLGAGWSIVVLVLLTHFALNLAMCIKRSHNAYAFYAKR